MVSGGTAVPMIPLFIPSKGRAGTHSSVNTFAGWPRTLVLHSEADKASYLAARPGLKDTEGLNIAVTGAQNLSGQRNWVLDSVKYGTWVLMADDNITSLTAVSNPSYAEEELLVQTDPKRWALEFAQECGMNRFGEIVHECIEKAEEIGARLIGFATVDNCYFRSKKWREVGYVIGKMILVKNGELRCDESISTEDIEFTSQHLLKDGCVLINNYLKPQAKHYQAGGCGTYNERIQKRLRDVSVILERYPGLWRIKDRRGFVHGTDVQMRFTSRKQVDNWRKEMATAPKSLFANLVE